MNRTPRGSDAMVRFLVAGLAIGLSVLVIANWREEELNDDELLARLVSATEVQIKAAEIVAQRSEGEVKSAAAEIGRAFRQRLAELNRIAEAEEMALEAKPDPAGLTPLNALNNAPPTELVTIYAKHQADAQRRLTALIQRSGIDSPALRLSSGRLLQAARNSQFYTAKLQSNLEKSQAALAAREKLVRQLALASLHQIRAADIAAQRSGRTVKAAAIEIRDAYADGLARLKQIAAAENFAVPTALDAGYLKLLDELDSAAPAEFDQVYAQQQAHTQGRIIPLLQRWRVDSDAATAVARKLQPVATKAQKLPASLAARSKLVQQLGLASLYQISAADIAAQRSGRTVKATARDIRDAYIDGLGRLKQIADGENISVPAALDPGHLKLLDALNSAAPAEFDKVYAQQQAETQGRVIPLLQRWRTDSDAATAVARKLQPVATKAQKLPASLAARSKLVQQLGLASLYQISAADIAVQKSSKALKAAAENLRKAYTRDLAKLKQIADAEKIAVPAALEADQLKLLDELNSAAPAEFDKVYAHQRVYAHKQMIEILKVRREPGSAALRNFANRALGSERKLLAAAQKRILSHPASGISSSAPRAP